jgi:GNAT superfamily N-acetyltransferase
MAGRDSAVASQIFAIARAGAQVGILATSIADQGAGRLAVIDDIWVRPESRRQGIGAEALRGVAAWARDQHAQTIWLVSNPADPAHEALFAGYPVRSQQMIKKLSVPGPLAAGLTGRPMTEAEFSDWRAESVRGYAADMADSGSTPEDLALAESERQFDQLLPGGLKTANHSFLCLISGGEVVATNWIGHRYAPNTSWVYGVEVNEAHRGKGYGRAAMIIGEQATIDASDSQLGLNVFGHNDVAIRLYNGMGYRAYDLGRSVEL